MRLNGRALRDMRRVEGLASKEKLFVAQVHKGRSEVDPVGYEKAVDVLHMRWRHVDLPRMDRLARECMMRFMRTAERDDQQAWREAEEDVYDCKVALGDRPYDGYDRRTVIAQEMRLRAKRSGLRIPQPRTLDRRRQRVYPLVGNGG